MGNKMESSIFVSAFFKGVFWHFKVDRRILLTLTVYLKVFDMILNFYTTVEYNESKYCIATLLFTESDTLCLLNWKMYFVLLLSLI